MTRSLIETQFPVSKISKESYKERKAGASQTLTGLGKWWGRKPLILVRATVLGLLMPASDDPERDRAIFLKILTMDEEGLLRRKQKRLPLEVIFAQLSPEERATYFEQDERTKKWSWKKGLLREQQLKADQLAFLRLNYDDKLSYCCRPEQMDGPSPAAWREINAHLGTQATNLEELTQALGKRQFGHVPRVGDAFCGGGSIPFEAARMGCDVYASDLNPAAALLTWAGLNIIGGGPEVKKEIEAAQQEVFEKADAQITAWGIEHNEPGWRADAYLYCVEARSPQTGYWVPLAPSWIISAKNKVCGVLVPDHENKRYHVNIVTNADTATFAAAKTGTVQNSQLVCPETGIATPISTLRGDKTVRGKIQYGLRLWENEDLVPHADDVFQERLYFIRYVETQYEIKKKLDASGNNYQKGDRLSKKEAEALINFAYLVEEGMLKEITIRHYVAPDEHDLAREAKVLTLLQERFEDWQQQGFIPSSAIPRDGDKTEEPIRTRGWTHWHHLFNPRQLLVNGYFNSQLDLKHTVKSVAFLLGSGKIANWNARLTRWDTAPASEKSAETFSNQALNALFNYSVRPYPKLDTAWKYNITSLREFANQSEIETKDARLVKNKADFWITDPPYADAINYHELGDFFLAWYEKQIPKLFPDWYADSRAALAVKGTGKGFKESMIECYSNFTRHMPDNGAQVVMFTHQDASVWADLALILWASGLQVTAAWTIQTETDAVGIKTGNYVQGTVIMILRKQTSNEVAFLSDIQSDVELGVKQQLDHMQALDDQDDPNFSDSDYQLAAYAAALRVITGYQTIQDIDVAYELTKEANRGEKSELEKVIEDAVRVAMDHLVPAGFSEPYWRMLTPEERFYLKGLEVEQHGEYRSGVYQEMARGFGLREYKNLLNAGKANQTRLKTALEFKNKELLTEGFGQSLVRQLLYALYETSRDREPKDGRQWLYQNDFIADYWSGRERMIHLLNFIEDRVAPLAHWEKDREALRLLKGYLENDRI